jgi:hypothetical protein
MVFEYKSAFLQRIADYVRTGHVAWVAGEVELSRAQAMVKKFNALYAVGRTRSQRAWAARQGLGNAVLLMYCPGQPGSDGSAVPSALGAQTSAGPEPTTDCSEPMAATAEPSPHRVRWILLVNGAHHTAHQLERLRRIDGANAARLVFDDYELVQLPRAGQSKPAWTWRMTKAAYEAQRCLVIETARRSPHAVPHLVQSLTRIPGFAGCRVQVKQLLRLAQAEHARRVRGGDKLACPPVRYVQRLKSGGVRLSQLQARNSGRYTP